MTDLVQLMASLVDSKGKILVDGIMDDVAPETPEEEALYEQIEFNLEEYKVRVTALMCLDVARCKSNQRKLARLRQSGRKQSQEHQRQTLA
jgi:hypothetical protein